MNRITRLGWHISVAALALSIAAAVGASVAWAAEAAPAATVPATASNHAAAVAAFQKARSLMQDEKYTEANAENERALKLEPDFAEALLLRTVIKGKLAEGGGANSPAPEATTPSGEKVRLLKPTDVAILRVSEWVPDADAQVRGKVARKVLDDFWNEVVRKQGDAAATSKEAHDAFVNPTNFAEQVRQIKLAGDPKYMEKVEFNADPAALAFYKKTVQPYVMQNCATAACHAGDKAGNFKLIRPANQFTDQSLYTNFYILSMYADKDGNKMIDRDNPDKSLLLQYGMIKTAAAKPHPGKPEVRFFTNTNDARFQPMVDWIHAMSFPRPKYGILYELPGSAATAPATKPAK